MWNDLQTENGRLQRQNISLMAERDRCQELFELAPVAYLETDLKGVVQQANHEAGQLFQIDPAALIGKPLAVFVIEQDRRQFYSNLQTLTEGGKRDRWVMGLKPQGGPSRSTAAGRDEVFYADVSVSGAGGASSSMTVLRWIIHDASKEAELRACVWERDMLERRDRELALLHRLEQTLSTMPDVEGMAESLLHEITQVLGTEGASLWLWDEEEQDCLICRAISHVSQETFPDALRLSSDQGLVSWVARSGESATVDCAATDERFYPGIDRQTGLSTASLIAVPLQARDKVFGVLEVMNKLHGAFSAHDRALVEALGTSAAIAIDNAQLFKALRKRTEELQARNEELDAFAHTVAHDINSPLAVVVGFAEVLAERTDDLGEEALQRYLHAIYRQGLKVKHIVDALLLLATVRKADVERTPLDMVHILDEVQERLAPLIQEREAQLVLPDTWPEALGYGPWIEEVWSNYISNGCKYGGSPPRLELGASRQDDHVRFWVRDNGEGLTQEAQARLFIPFSQPKSGSKGHGLGLSIVRRIVEKLGGQVNVESAPGQGATFWFTLPAATEALE